MNEHQEQVEELLAGYRRSREQLAAAQSELAAVRASASSPDGVVTATVGARASLTELKIADGAYERYRPAELAALIVRVTEQAALEAFSDAGEVLAPALGPGSDPEALLLGTADLTADEFGAAASAATTDESSFEDENWLHAGKRPGSR